MPPPKLAARSKQRSKPRETNRTMPISGLVFCNAAQVQAYQGGDQPVLSYATHFIFLNAIFILHLDTLSGEQPFFFSRQHMFPVFGGGVQGYNNSQMGEKVRQREKRGERSGKHRG